MSDHKESLLGDKAKHGDGEVVSHKKINEEQMAADRAIVAQVRPRRVGWADARARRGALCSLPPTSDDRSASARARLQTNQTTGLSSAEVEDRRRTYGFNELDEKKVNPLLMFLSYFWGPMPAMIWLAALVELIKGSLGEAPTRSAAQRNAASWTAGAAGAHGTGRRRGHARARALTASASGPPIRGVACPKYPPHARIYVPLILLLPALLVIVALLCCRRWRVGGLCRADGPAVRKRHW